MSYCLAFSRDGVMDVTRRYCRNPSKYGLPRRSTDEATLLHILNELKGLRRRDMDKNEKMRLEGEDMAERRELQNYFAMSIAAELIKINPAELSAKAAEQQRERVLARERSRQFENPNSRRR